MIIEKRPLCVFCFHNFIVIDFRKLGFAARAHIRTHTHATSDLFASNFCQTRQIDFCYHFYQIIYHTFRRNREKGEKKWVLCWNEIRNNWHIRSHGPSACVVCGDELFPCVFCFCCDGVARRTTRHDWNCDVFHLSFIGHDINVSKLYMYCVPI